MVQQVLDASHVPAGTPPRRPAPVTAGAARPVRQDIQALRAVAVTSVVVYHLWPQALPGGYVGVDVFFVISGFLITGQLVGELDRTGTVRLGRFWARRARRLLPAAFVVLAASFLLLVLVMPLVTWQATARELVASAAYVENWVLALDSVDYLAAESSATSAQHYWSLSVEEQFYLAWPLLPLVALAVARRTGREPRRCLAALVAAVVVVSFAGSVALTAWRAPLAFFATPVRAWEFGLGGLVALTPSLASRAGGRPRAAATLGLAAVGVSVLLMDEGTAFPGWAAALPVAGTALVIAAASPPRRVARAMAHPAVQWLGDHSYAVYLWHWPLLVAAPWVLAGEPDHLARTGLLVLTLALAAATTRLVERPVRHAQLWQPTARPLALAAVGIAVALAAATVVDGPVRTTVGQGAAVVSAVQDDPCFGAAAVTRPRCASPFTQPAVVDPVFAAQDRWPPAEHCQTGADTASLRWCHLGHPRSSATGTVALVGNSHAVHLAPALSRYGQEQGWHVLLAAKTDCLGVPSTDPVDGQQENCRRWSAELHEELADVPDLEAVVFASHVAAQEYLAGPRTSGAQLAAVEDAVVRDWRRLVDAGVAVLVVGDVPGTRPVPAPECVAADLPSRAPCTTARDAVVRPNLLTTLAQRHEDLVDSLDLTPYLCDARRCHAVVGGVVAYSDAHHLTASFAQSLSPVLGPSVADAVSRTSRTGPHPLP